MVNSSGSMSRAGGCCNESGSHVRAVQMLRNPWRREAHELPVLKRTSFLWAVSIMQRHFDLPAKNARRRHGMPGLRYLRRRA
ncbi:hypothetical protein D5086_014463 [Populus alba]|uniref:Uncharacterized protein n=1 Tax=Populus alba TaxID=43335 RepID=A0ACC4BZ05_POPAL